MPEATDQPIEEKIDKVIDLSTKIDVSTEKPIEGISEKVEEVVSLAKKIDFSTEDLKPYIDDFHDRLDQHAQALADLSLRQIETSRQIASLYEQSNRMQSVSEGSQQAIDDVAAIRLHLESTDEAVSTTLPEIGEKVERNARLVDLLNDRNINLFKWLGGIVVVSFVSSVLWQSLPQEDRTDLAKRFFFPLATIAGGSLIGYYFLNNGSTNSNSLEDSNTGKSDDPKQEG